MGGEQEGTFGARLRRHREAVGLTQAALAERAGLTVNAISQLERGERQYPYPHTVAALAEALGLAEDERAALVGAVPRRGAASAGALERPALTVPTPPTVLVGRGREMESVRSLLTSSNVRLLTLVGPGGVGKTSLAMQVAAELVHHFPDGAVFVSLEALSSATFVIPAIAHTLGLRQSREQSIVEVLHGFLRAKRMLLVLDNFEHVLAAAPEVAHLLSAGPFIRLLVTSRAPLRIRGEQEYPVPPLDVPDLSRIPLVEDVARAPAAQLFAHRAAEVAPGFELTQANAAAVAAICRRLDGLPLAIELAAARTRLLPPTALLARLDQVLPILVGGPRDLPERQRTMRTTIAWSYDLLRPSEQVLFRRLAVFAGGWTLEAVEAIAPDLREGAESAEDALGALEALLDNHLVQADAPERAEPRAEPRFTMLATIQAYALEQLQAGGDEHDVRERHADYFLTLAKRAQRELAGPDQAHWLDRLDAELDNVRVAFAWLLEQGKLERVVSAAYCIWRFWSIRGWTREGSTWIQRTLTDPQCLAPDVRARALYTRGVLLFTQGDNTRALVDLEAAAALARETGDGWLESIALGGAGHAASGQGDSARAETLLQQSLEMCRELNNRLGIGQALNRLGFEAILREDFERATALLDESGIVLRAEGNSWDLAVTDNSRALIPLLVGNGPRAEALLRRSIELVTPLRDTWSVGYALVELAYAAAAQGDARRSWRLLGAADALSELTGALPQVAPIVEHYGQQLAAERARLGDDVFRQEWAHGRAMSWEQAVAYALRRA